MTTASGRINRREPQQLSSSDVPYTIQRLQALPRGKEMVYYKGNFDADIENRRTPKHGALLRFVRDAARELAAQGKILLLERAGSRNGMYYVEKKSGLRVAKPYTAHFTEYVAIGNAP